MQADEDEKEATSRRVGKCHQQKAKQRCNENDKGKLNSS